ncbi:MAG: tyrosine recombinase XerC [Acidobacteria bacterium]|nr:tyrosine recombinase XerC [Acidobacteriota bacterium]MBI3280565.1 tyrosine recombinase XerC [Acidobacteriota bacterium]
MSDRSLAALVTGFLEALRRENASGHTLRNYAADLNQLVDYFSPPGAAMPAIDALDPLALREWLGDLYRRRLSAVTLRRKLAAVRSFYRHLQREGIVSTNVARLLRTPKTPKTLPAVLTPEQTNALLDGIAAGKHERGSAARDLAIFEMLYGCGLRVGELAALNLDDMDLSERWLRVRGKGRKEREVPLGSKAAAAVERYLAERHSKPGERAVFVNARGARLTDRGIRGIVKLYATLIAADSSIHPHSFRHAYATHLLADGADLRSIQELLGHARLTTTQKYTQVALADLMAVYDRTHPKA